MIKLTVSTKMDNKKIMEKAIEFFAHKNGLKITEQGDCCATFEGGGGYVRVDVVNNEKTEITLESREHDYLVKKFAESI